MHRFCKSMLAMDYKVHGKLGPLVEWTPCGLAPRPRDHQEYYTFVLSHAFAEKRLGLRSLYGNVNLRTVNDLDLIKGHTTL